MLLVGQEEVPETFRLGLLTDLLEFDRVGDPGLHLVVDRPVKLRLPRVDVFVHEGTEALEEPFNF